MPIGRHHVRSFVGWAIVASTVACPSIAFAQTTPKLEVLFPPGARRGTTVEVQFGGEFMPGPCRLESTGDGLKLKSTGAADRYRFVVADDAAMGPHDIRLASVQGASAPFPFVIGELPEIVHADDVLPHELTKLPVTANGRLDATGQIDEYAVTLLTGTQIVCAATTRAIRSPIDPMLRLLDAGGKPVAESFPHRSADALLVFRAPAAGRYTLQMFDFQLAGGADYVYRLTVTKGPWLDYAFPAGLAHDVETPLTVHGWNLPSPQGDVMTLNVPPQPLGRYELTLPGCANRLRLPVDELAAVLEAEPNDVVAQAATLSFPTIVNGRLNRPGDVDVFAFTAKKKDKVALNVEAAELGFPTDVVLAVVDETGKTLVELDDAKTSRDPSLRFTAPADGRYFVSVRDRSRSGGEEYVYRLHFTSLQPDVTARVNSTSLMVHAGQTTNLPVLVERVDGLADELEVTAVDLPAGVEVKPQPIPAKTPATVQLPFTVADKTAPVAGLIRIVVRGKTANETNERTAVIAESAAARSVGGALWLAVSPEIPFTLKTDGPILDAPRMAAFPFPVKAVRKEGFTGPIRLVGVEPDRRGTLFPLAGEIAAGSDNGSIPLVLQHKVTEGTTHRCRVMGVAEVPGVDGKTYSVFHVAAGAMSIGCQPSLLTLIAEPNIVVWRPGSTQSVTVQLMRRSTMRSVKLRLAPPDGAVGIECEPVEVGVGEDHAVLTLHFAPDAVIPPRTTIGIKAETSHDGLPIYGTTSFRLESP